MVKNGEFRFYKRVKFIIAIIFAVAAFFGIMLSVKLEVSQHGFQLNAMEEKLDNIEMYIKNRNPDFFITLKK